MIEPFIGIALACGGRHDGVRRRWKELRQNDDNGSARARRPANSSIAADDR
jgi:hypothetical protein